MGRVRWMILGILMLFALPIVGQDRRNLQPLDKRTRCLIKFRETLLLMSKRDIQGVFMRVADGKGPNRYVTFPDGRPDPSAIDNEAADPNAFVAKNFPNAQLMFEKWEQILFSDLTESTDPIEIRAGKDAKATKGTKSEMTIKTPGVTDPRFSRLQFVELDGQVFWVPFGW